MIAENQQSIVQRKFPVHNKFTRLEQEIKIERNRDVLALLTRMDNSRSDVDVQIVVKQVKTNKIYTSGERGQIWVEGHNCQKGSSRLSLHQKIQSH